MSEPLPLGVSGEARPKARMPARPGSDAPTDARERASSADDGAPVDGRRRVAFVIEALTVGGAEQMLVGLANRCRELGWDVHVICLTAPGELASRLSERIEVHVLDKRPRIDPFLPSRLRRLVRRLRPHAINSHLWVANFWTRASLVGIDVPVIASEHSRDSWKPPLYRVLDRCLAPFTHTLVAVSEDTARFYRHEIGIDDALIRVINNGVDTARYADCDGRALRARWAPEGQRLIGTVGRLVTAKNQARLLDMMARLVAGGLDDVRLVIVGDGPERAALERRVDALGLAGQVTLAGQRDDVPDALAAFDVFVLSSDREGHPLTALEAQSAGTPVVLTDVGGSADAVARDGEERGGFLVERDAAALADAVRRLADDPDLRARMAAFARRHALANFDQEHMVERYVALL